MGTTRTISIRLGIEEAAQLRQQLEATGNTGSAAFEKLRASLEKLGAQDTAQLEAALQRVTRAAGQATAAVGQAQANSFAGITAPSTGVDYAKTAASYAALGRELDTLQAKYSPLFAAQLRQRTALEEIVVAERQGVLSAQEASAAREAEARSYATAELAIRRTAEAIAEANQAVVNKGAGITLPGSAEDYARRAADIQAYAGALDHLRAKYDPVFASSKQYEGVLDGIAAAQKKGAITAAVAEAATARVNEAFAKGKDVNLAAAGTLDGYATSSKAATNAARQFGVQIVQGVSGLATGAPVMTTFIQQGHQLVDVALATGQGLGSIGTAAKAAFTAAGGLPTLLGVGVVGGLLALGVAAQQESTRLSDLRQQLRATQLDYESLAAAVDATAKRVAASSTLTTAQAREAAQAIASAKYFSGTSADIERLSKMSADLARVWNVDVAKAAATLRDAINDPAAAAKKFSDQGLPAFTVELVRNTERMQAAGQGGLALQVVLEALGRSSKGATQDQSPLQRALHDLEVSFYGARDGGKSLATSLGDFVDLQVARVVTGLRLVIEEIKGANDAATQASARARQAAADLAASKPSGGNAVTTPDATGRSVLLGPAIPGTNERATGIFQVLPSTARGYGLDPTNQDQNIQAGLLTLRDFYARAGSTDGALARYGGYGANVQGAAGYIGKVQAADPGKLPADLAGQIEYWGQILGLPPQMIALGQRIAAVESGGRQYAPVGQVGGATAQNAPPPSNPLGADYVSAPKDQSAEPGLRNAKKEADEAVAGLFSGTRAKEAQDLADQLKNITDRMAGLRAEGKQGTAEYAGLQQKLNENVAAANQLLSPQEKLIRDLKDQVAAGQGVYEGDRKLFALKQQIVALDRDRGGSTSAQQQAQAEALLRQQALQSLAQQVGQIDLTVSASDKLTAAYGQGYDAVARTTAANQAYAEALKLVPSGSKDVVAITELLTKKFEGQAQAARNVQIAQSTLSNKDQLEYLRAETASLGTNNDARNAMLAHLKAEQELKRQGVPLESELGRAYLASVDAISAQTAAYERQKGAFDELGSFVDHTASTISDAMVSSFAIGEQKALKFKDVASSVVTALEAEFAKLAVINPLKNWLLGTTSPDIFSVGGVLGNLFGGAGGSIDTSAAASFVVGASAGGGLIYDAFGNKTSKGDFDTNPENAAAIGKSATIGANGGISLSTAGSAGLTAVKGLDFLSGGKLLSGVKDFVFDAVKFTPGQSIGSWVSGLVGESATIGSALSTNASLAADVANGTGLAGAGASSASLASDIGSLGATGTAGSVSGLSTSVGTVGAGVQAIAEALPYIGAAVTIITDLATGNLRGAAIVAGTTAIGAAIGSVIPGIGTAIGAGVGATVGVLIDTFFPAHPKHPFQDTEVDVRDGHIVAGKTVNQIEHADSAVTQVTTFGEQLDKFMAAAGIKLTNLDSAIGHVGNNIKGLDQVDDVTRLFNKLQFADAAQDGSNFSVAKGALQGLTFDTPGTLTDELLKIARFADGMDKVGIQLASVGKDLTNISVASVSLTGALGDQAKVTRELTDPTQVSANDNTDPLRIALAHDLPGKTFANVDALSAELDKVNQFVNGTIPGLLNPTLKTVSTIEQQVDELHNRYGQAIAQADAYGLDTAKLIEAQGRAEDMIHIAGRKRLDQQLANLDDAVVLAGDGNPAEKFLAEMRDWQVQAEQRRDALIKTLTDEYGEAVKSTPYFLSQLSSLNEGLAAEAASKVKAFNRQQATNALTIAATVAGIQGRADVLAGDQQGADLVNFDAKSAQDEDAYKNQLIDFYGAQYSVSAEYQKRIKQLEDVQGGERLAIIKKYADQAAAAETQAREQAQSQVTSLYTSLGSYLHTLETGANNPASALDRYASADSQFNAVSGAAAAGDFASASKLTSYTDALLTTSREVNGSGEAYARDYNRVVDAISGLASASDALTASAQRDIAREQTATLVAAIASLQDEVKALRREVQHQDLAA